jgi:tRNA (mo5U34)-methyltransferase
VTDFPWYHTFDLPDGSVTPGMFDHRKVVRHLPMPASLEGRRCLDVAAADGFFSFELARRGAAEVVSVDLADTTQQDYAGPAPDTDRLSGPRQSDGTGTGRANQAFDHVRTVSGLDVERVDGSVYDLSTLGLGTFDYVFMGNILLHLRDPFAALEQVRAVTRPDGEFLSFEAISLPQTVLRPFTPTGQFAVGEENRFWTPNLVGHRRMVEAAGFDILSSGGPLLQPFGTLLPKWPRRRPRNLHEVVFWLFTRRFGGASAWVRARPRP